MIKLSFALTLFFIVQALFQSSAKGEALLYTYDLTPTAHAKIDTLQERQSVWDEQQLVAALQGLANRSKPRLYVYMVGDNGSADRFWLEKLREPNGMLRDYQLRPLNDLPSLLHHFRRFYRGVVVWDEHVEETSSVAATVSGAENLLPIRYDPSPSSLYSKLVSSAHGQRLPVKVWLIHKDGKPMFTGKGVIPNTNEYSSGSAKCDALLWATDLYLKTGRCNAGCLAYYPDAYWLTGKTRNGPSRTLLCNYDYFIAQRGFFFDLSPWDDDVPDDDPAQKPGTDAATLSAMLSDAYHAVGGKTIYIGGFVPWDQKYTDYTGGKHGGVATEWRYAEILSCYNAYMDADAPGLDAMANASIFQHLPLKAVYTQTNLPTEATLKEEGFLDANGAVVPGDYASIYLGDYDSAAWLYQRLPQIWNDPARGAIPLGWAFNPDLERRFPLGLVYTRETATPNDTFISGDSGAGYLNPGYLVPPRKWSELPSGLAAWTELCRKEFKRWDIGITGFVIDGNAPPMTEEVKRAYASFSPRGVVAQKIPPESLVDGVPFLQMSEDLSNPQEGAATIERTFPVPLGLHQAAASTRFHTFRTILWSPTDEKKMYDLVKRDRPDIKIVGPYTLFLLLKLSLEQKGK